MPVETLKTVEVEGPAGRIVINEKDLPDYKERGYDLVKEEPAPAPAPAPKKGK